MSNNAPLDSFGNPRLFEDSVRCKSAIDIGWNGEFPAISGVMPHFVTPFCLPEEQATVRLQNRDDLIVKAIAHLLPQSMGASIRRALLNHKTQTKMIGINRQAVLSDALRSDLPHAILQSLKARSLSAQEQFIANSAPRFRSPIKDRFNRQTNILGSRNIAHESIRLCAVKARRNQAVTQFQGVNGHGHVSIPFVRADSLMPTILHQTPHRIDSGKSKGYSLLVSKEMERRNSCTKRITAPDSLCGFFAPVRFMGGKATAIQDPQGENRPLGLVRVSTFLPTSRVARRNASVRLFKSYQGAFLMAQNLSATAPVLTLVEGIPTTTSLEISRVFEKRHDLVLRDIRNLRDSLSDDRLLNFAETVETRANPSGGAPIESLAYRLTRDGFTLLAMGFTGKKALQFKLAYIDAFNKMERERFGKAEQLPYPATIEKSPLEGQLYQAVCEKTKGDGNARHWLWGRLNAHFGLSSYKNLPTAQFESALQFVASIAIPPIFPQAALPPPSREIPRLVMPEINKTHDRANPYKKDGATIEMAQEICGRVRNWSRDLPQTAGQDLFDAMELLNKLLWTGWTEVDEALSAMNASMRYLHRWQGRGGRVGNVG